MRDIFEILVNLARWIGVAVSIVIATLFFTVMALCSVAVIAVLGAFDGLRTMYCKITEYFKEIRENKKEINND